MLTPCYIPLILPPGLHPSGGGATIWREDTMGAKTAITWDEFLAAGEEGQRWEWVDGEIQFMSPVNFSHEGTLAALVAYLFAYCQTHREWICFTSNCVFTMASGNWRMPDASLVRRDRFSPGRLPVKAEFPPDVAFEIISPGNTPSEIQGKRRDYLESGAIQVWIDQDHRSVELVQPECSLRFFNQDETLVIDSLPGFALELKALFAF
jgi:Uma2 family endonuclease